MAYFGNTVRGKQESIQVLLGDGINTYFPASKIKRSECVSNLNMSNHKYPSLSVRRGNAWYATAAVTTANGIGTYLDSEMHVLDGTTWKKWTGTAFSNIQTGMANARASFVIFSTSSKKYIICIDGTNKYSWDGSTAASLGADAPATNLYTVDDRRLYALLGQKLYFSAGGSITDWTTVNDAGSITLAGNFGTARAICTYRDTVISFYDNSMHILYGNDTYDFYASDPMEFGCYGSRALIELNGKLYFIWNNSLYGYAGGMPAKVSDKAKTYFEAIPTAYRYLVCVGKFDKYLYISIPYGTATENNLTLEYDTEMDIWNVHNYGFRGFTNIAGSLIGIDNSGQTWTINSGTDDHGTAITWEWVSGWIDYGVISKNKTISKQFYSLNLVAGSTLVVYYSTDGTTYNRLNTFKASGEEITEVTVPFDALTNIPRFRLKLSGTGPCNIEQIDEYFRIKQRL
ncbi:MAG: hypothetical protein ACM3O3_05235 [Syntrophothermus sp.]